MPRKLSVLLAGIAEHVIQRGSLPSEQSRQAIFADEDDMKTAVMMAVKTASALMLLG